MTADYPELLRKLFAARRFGVVLGLERMRALLHNLGAPHDRLGTVVHVAGTNGKGSTVAMIAALAAAGGKRVATYTSPHLSTVRERIVIAGELISEEAFVAAAREVQGAGGDELTFFEQLTAIAFVAIAAAHVEITVLEVGLGDRLEATGAVRVDADARARALAAVVHPGRFEWIGPDMVLDGAHNPDGAAALDALLRDVSGRRIVMILAVSADKDLPALVGPLAARATRVIATRYQQDRSLAADALAQIVRRLHPDVPVETAPDLAHAIAAARGQGDLVVVAGSLFLVGEARTLLLNAPTDPLAISDPAPTTA